MASPDRTPGAGPAAGAPGSLVSALRAIVGEAHVLVRPEQLLAYECDGLTHHTGLPSAVVLPAEKGAVARVVRACNAHAVPFVPRGAGTGLSGGALALGGGVVIECSRMNKILELDPDDGVAVIQPGVVNADLSKAAAPHGLFYAPDPSSQQACTIGGNVAENSGGPHTLKYGTTTNHVLALELVTADGELVRLGSRTGFAPGYDLVGAVVGSEGTLGVVTKIVLKLQPHPTQTLLMLVPFRSAESACAAVAAIFQAGVTPSGLEFMERNAIDWAVRYVGETPVPIQETDAAHLLIEVDGFHLESLYADCETITRVLENYDCGEIFFADNDATKTSLWKLRRNVGHAVKHNSVYKEEDTVVPRAELPFLLKKVKEVGAKYGFESVCYGHAGDGNLHVNILKGQLDDHTWNVEVPKGIREIFKFVKSKGGTISGEHGIGLVQRPYLDIVFSKTELRLMRQIKKAFDPRGILNPGKAI